MSQLSKPQTPTGIGWKMLINGLPDIPNQPLQAKIS
jgi:hypothetical protein